SNLGCKARIMTRGRVAAWGRRFRLPVATCDGHAEQRGKKGSQQAAPRRRLSIGNSALVQMRGGAREINWQRHGLAGSVAVNNWRAIRSFSRISPCAAGGTQSLLPAADYPCSVMNTLKRYVAIVVCLLFGGFLIADGWKELRNSWRLSREGRSVQGKVVDNETFQWKRDTTYYLSAEFKTADGIVHRKRLEVSSGVYYKGLDAGTVTVHYLPADPDICVAGDRVPLRFLWLLAGLGIFAAGLYLIWFFHWARKKVGELCITEHEYATVDARKFKHLDLAFYEQSQLLLETHGYRFLADREDLTLRRNSGLRIPLRVMVSGDGVTAAGIYH